jgi:hypothetical protein
MEVLMVGIEFFGAYIALGRMERDVFYRFRGGFPPPGRGL